jgi:hypothetical protein
MAAAQAAGFVVDADGADFIACRFAAQSGRAQLPQATNYCRRDRLFVVAAGCLR